MKPRFTTEQRANLQAAAERSKAILAAGFALTKSGKQVPLATKRSGIIVRRGYKIDLEAAPGVDSGLPMTENGN